MKPTLVLEKSDHPWQMFDQSRNNFRFLWHYHDECELFIPLEGQWKYLIGNVQGDIHAGDAFFLPPRLPHAFFTLSDSMKQKDHCYVLFFCLPLSAIDQIAGYSIAEMIRRRFQGGIRLTTPEPLRSALDTLKSCDGGLLAAAAFLQVLDALLGTPTVIPLAQKSLDDGQTHQTSEAVTRIGDFLARHYRERLTLEAIAEATCISVPTMCRLFRRRTGHSVFEYLREIRISRVKWQLAWTDRSITDIAGDCGFETLGHFYRTFHATTHLSPSAYRRSIQKRMHFPLRSP